MANASGGENDARDASPVGLDATPIVLGKALRTRTFCVYREVVGAPGRIAKVVRPVRSKRYVRWRVEYPASLYARIKYGIPDLIASEHATLTALPDSFRRYLPDRLRLERTRDGMTALSWDLPYDHDGAPSRFVSDVGRIENAAFWDEIDEMAAILRERRVFLLGIFNPGDLVVQKLSPERWRPIVCSAMLRPARAEFPFWSHLLLRPLMPVRFEQRIARFRASHAPAQDGAGVSSSTGSVRR